MASYIVQQYVAACGGTHALDSIENMCAVGKVKMAADVRKTNKGAGEFGGFVLWHKSPALWSLELMLSAFKLSAGCDGKVAWRQTPWRASRAPPRPLRRSLQVQFQFNSQLVFSKILNVLVLTKVTLQFSN